MVGEWGVLYASLTAYHELSIILQKSSPAAFREAGQP